jgi:hypothetical protein
MNLQYFPMDRQLCHIEIESCKYQTKLEIKNLLKKKKKINLKKNQKLFFEAKH